jgi:hypothetical protein
MQWLIDDFAGKVDLDEDQRWALELLGGIDLKHGARRRIPAQRGADPRVAGRSAGAPPDLSGAHPLSRFAVELSNTASWDTGVMPGEQRKPQTSEQRRRVDEIFGDVLPETTSDERDVERRTGLPDEWYRENRPPHHDR